MSSLQGGDFDFQRFREPLCSFLFQALAAKMETELCEHLATGGTGDGLQGIFTALAAPWQTFFLFKAFCRRFESLSLGLSLGLRPVKPLFRTSTVACRSSWNVASWWQTDGHWRTVRWWQDFFDLLELR